MNTDALTHHAATECPNCGAAVSGNFCHECGQETVLHPASTREFVHEFIGHYVAIEGKLWKSLGLLLFRPGRLTVEYIKGRRVRYLQPLRLYLTLSVIFFALLKYGGHDIGIDDNDNDKAPPHAAALTLKDGKMVLAPAPKPAKKPAEKPQAKPAAPAPSTAAAGKPDDTIELVRDDRPGEIAAGKKWAHDKAAAVSVHSAAKVDAFFDMSWEERWRLIKAAFYGYVPYAIFFMMPLFALYLKVLYLGSGRRYGEHLLFALHVNGFAYLAFTIIFAVMLLPDFIGLGLVKFLLWLWLLSYLPAAMRRVYGGSRILTGLRWLVLMFFHLLTMMLAMFGAVGFGIVH